MDARRDSGWGEVDGRRRRGRRTFAVLRMTGNSVGDGGAYGSVEAPPPDGADGGGYVRSFL